MAPAHPCLSLADALWSWVTGCLPKRLFRFTIAALTTAFGLTLFFFPFIFPPSKSVHRPPFATVDPIVHGKHVSDQVRLNITLQPFPHSPMILPTKQAAKDSSYRPWLAAVICAAGEIDRRMMIRSTWMQLYKDVPFDGHFVVSNPGPIWTEAVSVENRTFGDMIVLDHLHEDDMTANTIKTLELYKWLVDRGRRYDYVTKMDTDLWFNARAFWDRYLSPRISTELTNEDDLTQTIEYTAIGQLYYSRPHRLAFPHGSMYTHSWDMVKLLASLQKHFQVVAGEDQAVTMLMRKSGQRAKLVNLNGTERFDFDALDARTAESAWARKNTHPTARCHALYGRDIIAVHGLKSKDTFMKVAALFDEQGIKEMEPIKGAERRPPLDVRLHDFLHNFGLTTRYESQMDRIPENYWMLDNEEWICNGVWNMGHSRTGFQQA